MTQNMLRHPPKRQPTQEQLSDAYLGPCSIDNQTWVQVGNRTAKRTARRGSRAAQEAHATTSHPTMPGYVICWLFLGLCAIACLGGTPLLLLRMAGRGG